MGGPHYYIVVAIVSLCIVAIVAMALEYEIRINISDFFILEIIEMLAPGNSQHDQIQYWLYRICTFYIWTSFILDLVVDDSVEKWKKS